MKNNRFTEEEISTAIERYKSGETVAEIAKSMNRSRARLAEKMKQAGCVITSIFEIKHFNETKFDKIDSSEKAYWLGFLFADGNIGSNDNSIAINLQESDEEHLKKFKSFLEYDNDEIKVYKGAFDKNYCRFYCKNKHMHNQLSDLGCVANKSNVMTFPECIKSSEFFWDFVRGYFDGDGCLTYDKRSNYKEPRCSFACGSLSFITDLSILLKEKGFDNKVKQGTNCYILTIGDRKWLTNAKFLNQIYANSSVYLQRKYEKYLKYRGRSVEQSTESLSGKIGEG